MEAKDLRIGNLISHFDEPKEITVKDLVWIDAFPERVDECYKPITINENWLLKFGFEKKSGSEFKNDRFIYRFKQKDLIIEGFEYDYNGILCYHEYVHQLQNLYFALSGEELKMKELVQ